MKKSHEDSGTLGCAGHKDRRCSNARTISERKAVAAITTYLRDHFSRPDRVERFLAAFQAKSKELEDQDSPAKAFGTQIERQRQKVEAVTEAMVMARGSKALADRLAVEERKLADLDQQLRAVTSSRPKVLPHPARDREADACAIEEGAHKWADDHFGATVVPPIAWTEYLAELDDDSGDELDFFHPPLCPPRK